MGILCARKGCGRKKAYGLFCVEHKPAERLVDPRPRCAAKGCFELRKGMTLFCDGHQRAMDRECFSPKAFDTRVEPFRAPLPDRKIAVKPVYKEISRDKLSVRWRADQRRYEAWCRSTNVVGHGPTPGDAIRNWQFWWDIPF